MNIDQETMQAALAQVAKLDQEGVTVEVVEGAVQEVVISEAEKVAGKEILETVAAVAIPVVGVAGVAVIEAIESIFEDKSES